MNWHRLRSEEGRGFVSKRIFWLIVDSQLMIFGEAFYYDYGAVKRLLTMDEIINLGFGILWEKGTKE
jgi:hypothetical protein